MMLTSTSFEHMFTGKGLQLVLLPNFQTKERNLLMAYSLRQEGLSSNADFISNLPECIKQEILIYLPIKEAVRTCILSKSWRYNWRTLSDLKVNAGINSGLDENRGNDEFSRIIKLVDQLLNCHKGNILKFKLFGAKLHGVIPQRLMHILSQKQIRELTIDTGSKIFVLASNSIQVKLETLVLRCCTFVCLPGMFDGTILHTLDVRKSFFSGGIERLISNCPLLQNLKFEHIGVDFVNICSQNLRELTIFGKSSKVCLITPNLCLAKFVYSESAYRTVEFRGNIIQSSVHISHTFNHDTFGCFLQKNPTTHCLPTMVVTLDPTILGIYSATMMFQDFSMIQKLILYLDPIGLSCPPSLCMSIIKHVQFPSLRESIIKHVQFPSLREATIIPFLNSKPMIILQFTKIILNRAPLLEKLTIRSKMKYWEVSILINIISQLSTRARIIFDNSCLNVGGCCCSWCDITCNCFDA